MTDGTAVALTASAGAAADFTGWTGACNGTGTCAVTVTTDVQITATFQARPPPNARHTLTVTVIGSGAVRSTPAGIDCGASCVATYDAGTSVTLVAAPAPGFQFGAWGGACSGSDACVVRLDSEVAVSARFDTAPPPPPAQHTLSVTLDGSGNVASTPAGIDCGAKCSAAYDAGARVSLKATPAAGWRFASWSGACSGGADCAVTLDTDVAVKATFIRTATLHVSFSGNGHGTITAGATSCTSTCDVVVDAGTALSVSAAVGDTARFMGWTGPCSGIGDCSVQLNQDLTVGAIFWPYPAYTVEAIADDTGRPGGIDDRGDVVFVMSPPSLIGDRAWFRDGQTGALRQIWPTDDALDTAISPNGQQMAVSSFAWLGGDDSSRTWRRVNGAWLPVRDLGGADGTWLASIDDDGVIFGVSHVSGTGDQRIFHGVLEDGSRIVDLGTTERSSWAGGRGGGRIFGAVWDSPYEARRAAVWESDGIHLLGSIGGADSFARGINSAGVIVGDAQASDYSYWGFIWDPQTRTMRNVGGLPGGRGSALYAINDAGLAVGEASSKLSARGSGALWFNGRLWDLNDLVQEQTTVLEAALRINARGQIVGNGMIRGKWCMYLLTPR